MIARLLMLLLAGAGTTPEPATSVRINEIQAVGTHNSYKQAMPSARLEALRAVDPSAAKALDYRHRALVEQLDHGARQLEIDVVYDPQGGRYAGRSHDPELMKPGFKVLHMPGIDNGSSCLRLVQCLRIVARWSDAHPDHVPILMLFNAKDERNAARGGIDALPFDAAAYDALDAEIRSILPPRKLIVPDDVQGGYPTLRDAVRADNWPLLDEVRGRFLFALDESPAKVAVYRGARASLEGRVFFVNTDEDSPAAAYLTLNDPIAQHDRIARDVAANYLVRTRADADTVEARANSVTRRDAALASGAQYVSTDYLWPDARFGGSYHVPVSSEEPAKCNPVRASTACSGSRLERRRR